MITYEPKPFLDVAPVNALIHNSAMLAYRLTVRDNNRYFKRGYLAKKLAQLDIPHTDYPSFTHSHINALRIANVYSSDYPTGGRTNTFTYSPTDSMAGGVFAPSGGMSSWVGVNLWSNVNLYTRLSVALHNVLHHKMVYNLLLKQCKVTEVSYCYTRKPVKQSPVIDSYTREPVKQSRMIDNAIIVQSRPMSPHTKAYKAIQSGALVYVEVDNEFVAIGKIH